VLLGHEGIDSEFPRRHRHELHETNRSLARERERIEGRFGLDDRPNDRGLDVMETGVLVDKRIESRWHRAASSMGYRGASRGAKSVGTFVLTIEIVRVHVPRLADREHLSRDIERLLADPADPG